MPPLLRFLKAQLLLIFLTFVCIGQSAIAQVDMFKYFDPGVDEPFSYDYLKVDFKWDVNGPLQMNINEGINYLEEDNAPLALNNLNKAVELDSNLWVSYYYRGICNRKLFNLEQAEKDFLKAIALNPNLPQAEVELAETYLTLGNPKKTENHLDEAIKKNPMIAEAYFGKGMLELAMGNPNRARRQFEKAIEVNPKLASAYLMLGLLKWILKHDDVDAVELFGKAVVADSSFLPAYFWRGIVKVEDHPEECLKDWNFVVQLDPLNPFYVMMRGYLYIELKNYDMAFVDLKNALKAQSINEDKYSGGLTILDKKIDLMAVGNYLVATGYGLDETAFTLLKKSFCMMISENNEEALKSAGEAELKQASATAYFIKAHALENSFQKEKAFQYYNLALSLDNDIYDAHRKKCIYFFEKLDWKNVHVELREMFRLQPASPVGLRLRGMVRLAQGLFGPAIGDFNEYIKKDSSDTEVIHARVMGYIGLNMLEKANEDLFWLLRRDPNNWNVCNQIVTNYLSMGDSSRAITFLEKFLESKPRSIDANFRLVEIYVSQANWIAVKTMLNNFSSLSISSWAFYEQSKIKYWQGMISLYHLKKAEEAIQIFNESLKLNPTLEAKYERAKAYEKAGWNKLALKEYEELMNKNYKDSEKLYNLLLVKKAKK